jgi:phospholipase/carboxylesterase
LKLNFESELKLTENENSPKSAYVTGRNHVDYALWKDGLSTENYDITKPLLLIMHGFGSNELDIPGIIPILEERFGLGDLQWVSLRAPLPVAEIWATTASAWMDIPVSSDPPELAEMAKAASDGVIEWIANNLRAETRIIPFGFSQGGCMSLELAKRADTLAPVIVDRVVCLSGFVSESAVTNPALSSLRIFYGYGQLDDIVPVPILHHTDEWLRAHTSSTVFPIADLRHNIDFSEMAAVANFLKS